VRVEVNDRPDDFRELVLDGILAASNLTEHDLRDIEFALARRRAMGRLCPEQDREHTCSLPPGHLGYAAHLCRACTYHWSGTTL
jgi:hypothetical protein